MKESKLVINQETLPAVSVGLINNKTPDNLNQPKDYRLAAVAYKTYMGLYNSYYSINVVINFENINKYFKDAWYAAAQEVKVVALLEEAEKNGTIF